MAEPTDFLTRWSRLKRRARKPQPPASAAMPSDAAALAPAPAVPTSPAELPPLESLTVDSDYTAFMRPNVTDATRNAALQKLWRSDPVFANLDGLVEYGEDYAAAFKVSAAVRTAYRVAQGMGGDAPPPEQADQPPHPKEKSPPAGATSQPESGTESSSDQSAKAGNDMHEDRVLE